MKTLCVSTTKQEQYLGWFYLVFQMLILPDLILLVTGLMGFVLTDTSINVIFFSINFLATVIVFRRFLWLTAKQSFRKPIRLLKSAGLGFVLYWFFNFLVINFTIIVSPQYQNVNDATIGAMAQGSFTAIAICTILLAPVYEELLFRGLMFQGLFRRDKFLAYGVSSAVFSLIHLVGYIGLISPLNFLVGFVQYLPAGIAFGYAYEKADSIFAPIIMHMMINAIGMFAMR